MAMIAMHFPTGYIALVVSHFPRPHFLPDFPNDKMKLITEGDPK